MTAPRDGAEATAGGESPAGGGESGRWVTAVAGASGFRVEHEARSHRFVADEPVALGGTDAGPTPYEHLLAALGGCTAMTLRMYADRKGWPLERAVVRLRSARDHERDCEECERADVGIARVEREIELHGALDEAQRARLLAIADRCPVKQTVERGIRIVAAGEGGAAG